MIVARSNFEAGSNRIPVKHSNRIQRELIQIFAAEIEKVFQNGVRHSDNMTTASGSLENVKHLTNACPKEFSLWQSLHDFERLLHYRQWIDSGIGDSSSED